MESALYECLDPYRIVIIVSICYPYTVYYYIENKPLPDPVWK